MTSTCAIALERTFSANPFSAPRRERIPEKMRKARPAEKNAAIPMVILLGARRRLDEPVFPRRRLNSAVSISVIVLSDSRDNILASSFSNAPNHRVRRPGHLLASKRFDEPD